MVRVQASSLSVHVRMQPQPKRVCPAAPYCDIMITTPPMSKRQRGAGEDAEQGQRGRAEIVLKARGKWKEGGNSFCGRKKGAHLPLQVFCTQRGQPVRGVLRYGTAEQCRTLAQYSGAHALSDQASIRVPCPPPSRSQHEHTRNSAHSHASMRPCMHTSMRQCVNMRA